MNPMTQYGLATLARQDPARAMYAAQQYQQRRNSMPYERKLTDLKIAAYERNQEEHDAAEEYISKLPPDQQMLARANRSEFIKNSMSTKQNNLFPVSENASLFDPKTGTWISPPKSTNTGATWDSEDMRKEFDYSKYTLESIKKAEAALDPSLMKAITPVNYGDFSKAREAVEKRLAPVRQGMFELERVFNQLKIGGGAADLRAIVAFTKALDPGSVAREGEVSLVRQAEGYIEEMLSITQRAKSQGMMMMTPVMRENMHKAAMGLQEVYEGQYRTYESYYDDYATQFNFPKNLIMGSPIDFPKRVYEPVDLGDHPLKDLYDAAAELAVAEINAGAELATEKINAGAEREPGANREYSEQDYRRVQKSFDKKVDEINRRYNE